MVDVLLIDDDVNESKLIDCYLKQYFGDSYSFSHAYDVGNAEQYLSEKQYDVVFLDNRLGPHRDFTTTLPRLNNLLENARIFLISASVDDPCFASDIPNVDGIIDKFNIKSEIQAGLLG